MLQFCLSVCPTICPSVCLSSVFDKWQMNNQATFPTLVGGGKGYDAFREERSKVKNDKQSEYMSNLLFSKGRKYSVKMQNGRRKSFFASGDHGFFIFLLLYIRKLKGSFNANFLVWTVSQIDLLPCQFLIFSPTFSLVKKINKSNSIGTVFEENLQQERHRTGFCSLK